MSEEVTKICRNRGCALVGVEVKIARDRDTCVACGRELELGGTDALIERMTNDFEGFNPFGKR